MTVVDFRSNSQVEKKGQCEDIDVKARTTAEQHKNSPKNNHMHYIVSIVVASRIRDHDGDDPCRTFEVTKVLC